MDQMTRSRLYYAGMAEASKPPEPTTAEDRYRQKFKVRPDTAALEPEPTTARERYNKKFGVKG